MPSPVASWNTVRVHVTFYDRAGSAVLKAGTYKVTIEPTIGNTPQDAVIPGGVYASGALLQIPGGPSFDMQIPATDDPDNTPLGFLVRFDFTFTDGSTATGTSIPIPVALSGDPDGVDLLNYLATPYVTQIVPSAAELRLNAVEAALAALNGGNLDTTQLDGRYSPLLSPAHVVNTAGTTQAVPGPSVSVGPVHQYGLTAASCDFTLPTGLLDLAGNPAQVDLVLFLVNNGGGTRGYTVPSSVTWDANGKPAIGTTSGATTIVTLTTMNGGTSWLGSGPTVASAGSGASYTDEQAQDAAAALFAAGTHSGITFTYDDTGNRINAAVTSGGGSFDSINGGNFTDSQTSADTFNGGTF